MHSKVFKIIIITFLIYNLLSCSSRNENVIKIGVLEGPSAISFVKLLNNQTVIKGKKVEIIVRTDPQQIQALMMRNELDFSILPTVMAVNLYNKGVKFRMLACPVWGTLFILSRDKNIKSLNNLSNQDIEVFGQGATPDILLQYMLERNEIKNVQFGHSFTGNTEIANALLSGKIKNAVVSEPLVSVLLSKDTTIHIVSKLDCEDYMVNSDKDIFVQTAFLVNSRFISKHSEYINDICSAYSKSCNFVNEDPLTAAELLVKYNYFKDVNIAKKSIPFCNIQYIASFAIENELERYLSIYFKYNPKTIGGKMPARDFIY